MPTSILLLPGMGLNRTAYPDFGVPTICPDFNSRAPAFCGGRGARMDDYVDALDQWLKGKPEWDSAQRLVVGHSFGGMLAMSWLLRHSLCGPAKVDGLVLISTTAGPMYDVLRPVLMRVGRFRLRTPVTWIIKAWSIPTVMRGMKTVLAGGRTEQVDFRRINPATDYRIGIAGWRNTDWQAMRCYRMALDGFDIRDKLNGLRLPVEVLHGSRDTLFPTRVGRALADPLPDARLTIVQGASHTIGLTHPQAMRDAVTRLRELPSKHFVSP